MAVDEALSLSVSRFFTKEEGKLYLRHGVLVFVYKSTDRSAWHLSI